MEPWNMFYDDAHGGPLMMAAISTNPAGEAEDALEVGRRQDVPAHHALAEVWRIAVDDAENCH